MNAQPCKVPEQTFERIPARLTFSLKCGLRGGVCVRSQRGRIRMSRNGDSGRVSRPLKRSKRNHRSESKNGVTKRRKKDIQEDEEEKVRSLSDSPTQVAYLAPEDKEGLVQVSPGDVIKNRFKVLSVAGQGTFGTVLNVHDSKHDDIIALKVVRAVDRYLEAAYVETTILDAIRDADPKKKSLCVRLYCHFEATIRGQTHVCLGFEKLGKSLYDFLKKNRYRGFRLRDVRAFGRQLLTSVAFMHDIRLVHTDLKPENILLVKSDYRLTKRFHDDRTANYMVPVDNRVKVIDFGGATFEDQHHSRIINTRQYRSPEVLLGLDWSYPSDLWSIGCILAELYTGELLFSTHDDLEHLALMEKIMGEHLPTHMVKDALRPFLKNSRRSTHRDDRTPRSPSSSGSERDRSSSQPRPDKFLSSYDWRLRYPRGVGRESRRRVQKQKRLEDLFPDRHLREFVDLLRGLLQFDPLDRLTATEALKLPFFN